MQRAPRRFFAVVAIVLTLVMGLGLWYWLPPTQFFWIWLAASGSVTFLFYGFDKMQAKRRGWRVPEIVLHGLALAGGFIGAALGMAAFNHKTSKRAFMAVIVLSGVLWFGGYFML